MARAGRATGWPETPPAQPLAILACIALLLVSTNVLAWRYLPQHFDLTTERLYTLSPETRATLAKIDEPITLRFFLSTRLSDALPAYDVYAQRVGELLDEYTAAAHGKIRLETYDPQPFSAAEDRAVALGLQGAPLNGKGDQVYFGLAGSNSTDDRQTIPFFARNRERLLEYDLTRLVHALAYPEGAGEGLISPRSRGSSARPFTVIEHMQHKADTRYAAEQQALEQKLKAAEAKLRALTAGEPERSGAVLSPDSEKAVAQFRADILATRRQLRGVQAAAHHRIDRLERVVELLDIALAPILVAVAALIPAARQRRWRRSRRTAPA